MASFSRLVQAKQGRSAEHTKALRAVDKQIDEEAESTEPGASKSAIASADQQIIEAANRRNWKREVEAMRKARKDKVDEKFGTSRDKSFDTVRR